MHKFSRHLFALSGILLFASAVSAQIAMPEERTSGSGLGVKSSASQTPAQPSTYEIGGITISGAQFLDEDLLLAVTGLTVGQQLKLPNDDLIAKAIRNLWKQELFSDVGVEISRFIGNKVFLNIRVEERPKLSRYNFKGVRKSEGQELRDKLKLVRSRVFTEGARKEAVSRIRRYFMEKGYADAQVRIQERGDSSAVNSVIVTFDIDKGLKTKIAQVSISGNEKVSESRLKRTLRSTKEGPRISLYPADTVRVYGKTDRSFARYLKEFNFLKPTRTLEALNPYFRYNIFSSAKLNEQKFAADKEALIAYYNSLGYRDAAVVRDTIYHTGNGNLNIEILVDEGNRYYFGDISWRGNTKYTDAELTRVLNIRKGDVYNLELLESRIGRQLSPEGGPDVSSMYMDDGYLFFNVEPVEVAVVNDTIHYEMRITEGQQATIRNVFIAGNDRTNEHVIRRELRTLPGNKFSRADLIRSQREIANLNFFDQEKIGIQPRPNPEEGTVDIEYSVVEKSSDQLQLSVGFGGGISFYGNIGIVFNNFSLNNIFNLKSWDPLPVGDGQRFSINYQSNGAFFNSFNASFTEPWLGGRKPNALTTSFMYSRLAQFGTSDPNSSFLRVVGGGVSLSKRLKWPDDYFVFTYGLNYQNYKLKNYGLFEGMNNGTSNNFHFRLGLARYSVDQPLYPRSGSNISLALQITPPYSALGGQDDFSGEAADRKYKWIEYHKYRFTADWYKQVVGNLVLKVSTKYGFLGYYNPTIGHSPFERFQLGGDGLQMTNFFIGRDIISQRGYLVYAENATIFNKYTMELRYPFSLSPTSTIYGLVFADAANAWFSFKDYNPFRLNRDAGVGIRIFLPMFGLLGLDYGIGFDKYDPASGNTGLKSLGRFNFMLGFEPD